MQEKENYTFKDRIQKAFEWGFGYGINGLELRWDNKKVMSSFLYKREEKRAASNVYLMAVYENAYFEGKRDRDKIVSIAPMERPRFDMRLLREAFDLGRLWRKKTSSELLFEDDKLEELMKRSAEVPDDNWEWIEGKDLAILDCWQAGFLYEGEESFGDKNYISEKFVIACDRMRKMRSMYDQGEEPGYDTDFRRAFSYFLEAAEKLVKIGKEELIDCMCCPYPYWNKGEFSDGRSAYSGCDKDCRAISEYLESVCEFEKRALEDYYIVPEFDYYPLEEERYIDWP